VAQQRQHDETLRHDADRVATAFTSYFERARSLDLLLAQNPVFRPPAGREIDNADANRALLYLEDLYPGTIGEACLIDEQGREAARVTDGVAARIDDLSSDEAQNPFFAATLALPRGEVYQATPYVSADTGTWVISNSTWVRQPDGERLIVHFEVSLASFQQWLTTGSAGSHAAVVDQTTGLTTLEDHDALPATDGGTFDAFSGVAVLAAGETSETIRIDGRHHAIAVVTPTEGNANDWAIVEWSTARASFLPLWVGGASSGIGLLLILLFLVVLHRQQASLRMASRLDHLTGMANRKALEEALDAAVASASQPRGERIAVLMLDLDGFKQINDALGHDKGDLVLQEIGRRLHANIFEYDTAARLGGDEFAVVLRQLRDADDVAAVGHRLRDALVRPLSIDGIARFIGVSIGAALYGEHGSSPEALLQAADAAMYQAKRGRDGVGVYDAGTAAGADASWLAAELLLAIENEEITMAFQPTFALDTGCIVGAEALARWHRPTEPQLPPAEFVALAERTGLIRQLTHLTLRIALDQAQHWHTAGQRIPVSVNLSARLVTDRSLRHDIEKMLADRKLGGDALVLEITEGTVVKDLAVASEVLQGLRSIGIRIDLDDFGTGFASFKALHELPLDGVKIDRDLVNDTGAGGQRLLAATIDIAQRLGLTVIAEGIEDDTSLARLRELGADSAQGYHLARPMAPETIGALLRPTFPITT
jgi:diguanylate cyclase (GGDEF)-like protein